MKYIKLQIFWGVLFLGFQNLMIAAFDRGSLWAAVWSMVLCIVSLLLTAKYLRLKD